MVTRVKLDVSSPSEHREEIGKGILDRIYSFILDIKNVDKSFDTGAVFHTGDKHTSVLLMQLKNGEDFLNILGCEIVMNVMKPNDEKVNFDCTIIDHSAGVIGVELPSKALDEVGTCKFEISVKCDKEEIFTPIMHYRVVGGIGLDSSTKIEE